jgi:hypothetical protein
MWVQTEMKKKLIVSFLVGLVFAVAIIVFALTSAEYRVAKQMLSTAPIYQQVGRVECHFMTRFKFSYRDDQTTAKVSLYVVGERQRGWLRVSLEREKGVPRVVSATFNGQPLALN